VLEAVRSCNSLSLVDDPLSQAIQDILPIRPEGGHHLRLAGGGPKRGLSDSGVYDGEPSNAVVQTEGVGKNGQLLNQLPHGGRRTPPLLRICGVRGRALKTENRSHRPGGKRAALDLNLTEIFSREIVEGKDPVRGDRLKSIILEDAQRADSRFLGRLEEQDNPTSTGWMTVQLRRKSGDDRHMSVVPARVGDPGPARAMIDVVFLGHRHRVDLGTEHDRRAIFTTLVDCRQPNASKIRHEPIRLVGFEKITNDPARLDLLTGELGVSVEFAPQSHQLGQFG